MNGHSSPSVLRWTIVALTAAAMYVCWPLWPALVLAAWTAALARPLLVRFERVLKGRRRAAAVLSLLLFLVLALPLVAIVLGVVSGAQQLAHLVAQQSSAKNALASIATGTGAAPTPLPNDLATALDLVRRYGPQSARFLQDVAGAAAAGVIALFIYFAGAHAFLLHGSSLWDWVRRHSPIEAGHLERYSAAFQETGRGLLVGVGLTSATQGAVATLAYLSLGVPSWWVLGPITGLASMIPVVGSGLVWAPITVGFFLTGHTIKGSVLAVFGFAVISSVDNLLRPVYARFGSLRMPTFLLFVSLFGGMAAFGAWGAILGPLIVRLWIEALALQSDSLLASADVRLANPREPLPPPLATSAENEPK